MNFSSKRPVIRELLIDMTPMVDVVFQLLIFFLTTAQMASVSRANIDLPRERGEQNQVAEEAGMIINITATGEIIIADQPLTLDELDALLSTAVANAPGKSPSAVKVLLRADRNAPASHLNAVIERLHKLGLGAARIATSPPG